MIEVLEDMPEGVLGFRLSGVVSRSEYDDVLMAPIRSLVREGGKARVVCQLGPGLEGYEGGGVWDDVRAGDTEWGLGRHPSWERIAVVTDIRKVRILLPILGWLSPGDPELFGLDELADAVAWASGSSDRS